MLNDPVTAPGQTPGQGHASNARLPAIGNRDFGLLVVVYGALSSDRQRAAAAVAEDLGTGLIRIDVSPIVSTYIGETEKNLSRVFDAAETRSSVLFFDEADALFGKRAAVGRTGGDRRRAVNRAFALMRRRARLCLLGAERVEGLDPVVLGRVQHIVIAGPAEGRTDSGDSRRER
jgi:AAA+ superfamily predicted ATPase